jgi:hypothetical protein
VAELTNLFTRLGGLHYGEDVSQMEHALQTAHHAKLDGAPPSMIAAALLHDVGHLLQKVGENAADLGVDTRHEHISAGYLARAFGPEVTEPIRLHVAAKRYRVGRGRGIPRTSQHGLTSEPGPARRPDEPGRNRGLPRGSMGAKPPCNSAATTRPARRPTPTWRASSPTGTSSVI